MVRTSLASSELTLGRPTRPRRDFQVQKARNPCRCQRITVSGRRRWNACRHPDHCLESHTQKKRSRRPNCGRFDRRRSRASCCRSAKFSSVRSVRVLSAARRASTRGHCCQCLSRHSPTVQRPDRVLANDSLPNRSRRNPPELSSKHDHPLAEKSVPR